MSSFTEQAVERHVARSLAELREHTNGQRWVNGERAKEQAAEIVATIIAGYIDRLEGREQGK